MQDLAGKPNPEHRFVAQDVVGCRAGVGRNDELRANEEFGEDAGHDDVQIKEATETR